MAAKQAMKENLQCTSKYGHLRISQDICHVRITDIEGFLTIYGHSDNLLNNNIRYPARPRRIIVKYHQIFYKYKQPGQHSNMRFKQAKISHIFGNISQAFSRSTLPRPRLEGKGKLPRH